MLVKSNTAYRCSFTAQFWNSSWKTIKYSLTEYRSPAQEKVAELFYMKGAQASWLQQQSMCVLSFLFTPNPSCNFFPINIYNKTQRQYLTTVFFMTTWSSPRFLNFRDDAVASVALQRLTVLTALQNSFKIPSTAARIHERASTVFYRYDTAVDPFWPQNDNVKEKRQSS